VAGLVLVFRRVPVVQTIGITFVAIVLEALPFMLLGATVGGVIEVWVSREKIASWLPARGGRSVFYAAALGMFFPVCECAIVPVIRRLLQKGVPLSAAIAFLLAGPIVNPVVIGSTAVAYLFDVSVVLQRTLCGYAIAVTVGSLMGRLFGQQRLPPLEGRPARGQSVDAGPPASSLAGKFGRTFAHAAEDFFDIGRYLIVGAFLAAAIQALLPRSVFTNILGNPPLSILAMMLLAMALNLCSEADAFVAASFRFTPVPLSAQLAFMVLGPMLDIKLLLMYVKLFRGRMILALSAMTFGGVFFAMLVMEWFGV
jgi:uncharacterized membrane protein YraQ (UPF0718 family)